MLKGKALWGVLAFAVVLGGLSWSGVLSNMFGTQEAAVVMSQQTDPALSSATMKSDAVKINAQLDVATSPLPASPTKDQIISMAASIKTVSAMMQVFAKKLQSININAKTSGGAVSNPQVMADMLTQIANAGSQSATAAANVKAVNASSATIQTSALQIAKAQSILTVARAEMESLVQGIK